MVRNPAKKNGELGINLYARVTDRQIFKISDLIDLCNKIEAHHELFTTPL